MGDKSKDELEIEYNLLDCMSKQYFKSVSNYINWYQNDQHRNIPIKNYSKNWRQCYIYDAGPCYTVFNSHKDYEYWQKKDKKNKKKGYLYLTLSPDKILRNMDNTPEMKKALYDWCNNWFAYNPKYYMDYIWCIECGSHGDHLHVHAVVELINSHKHAENLKKSWNKHFPKNQLLTSVNLEHRYKCELCKNNKCKNNKHRGEYAYYRFDDLEILNDKIMYFENEKKGTHENKYDLNLRGSRGFNGFLTDNI